MPDEVPSETAIQKKIHPFHPGHPQLGKPNGKIYRSLNEQIRRVLESRKAYDVDPRYGRTKLEQIIYNLAKLASSKSPYAVAAAQVLLDRGYGRPRPSDEELDAIQKGGFRLIMISPEADPEIAAAPEKKALPKPEFLDAEVVSEQS